MIEATSKHKRPNTILRILVEIAFIIFLFYANLLMGEFTRTNRHGKTLLVALNDIFNPQTLAIAIVTAIIGYIGFESMRRKL